MLGGTASQNRHTLCCCSHQPSAVTPRLLQSVLRGCQANHTMFKPVLETWFVKIQRNVLKYSGVRRAAFHTTACSSFCSSCRALCVLTAAKYQPNGGGCRCSPFNRNSWSASRILCTRSCPFLSQETRSWYIQICEFCIKCSVFSFKSTSPSTNKLLPKMLPAAYAGVLSLPETAVPSQGCTDTHFGRGTADLHQNTSPHPPTAWLRCALCLYVFDVYVWGLFLHGLCL